MPSRSTATHDPFTDAPLRPTSSNAVRAHPSQHSLRSNASASSSSRTRGPPPPAPPPFSRRQHVATSDILADDEAERERPVAARRARRHDGAGEEGSGEVPEFVIRGPDGKGFLLPTAELEGAGARTEEEEREVAEVDAHYAAISRQFFASGAAVHGDGRGKRGFEDELEQLKLPMMLRLREQVADKLEGERWRFEDVERFPPTI